MKMLILALALLSSPLVFTKELNNKEIADLYTENKTDEKSLAETKLSEVLKKSLIVKLEKVAKRISNIWGDTILEGPYSQLEDAKLDLEEVKGIFYNNELIGFSAEVSALGAYSDECEFNDAIAEEIAEREFNKCLENFKGRIYEKFLVNKRGEYVDEYFEPADFTD